MNHGRLLGGVLALLLAVAAVQPVSAQRAGSWTWNPQYSTVLGVGDTGDFAGGFSWRGLSADVERAMSNNATLGLTFGWHILNEKSAGTTQFPGGAITGTAYRSLNSFPILVTGNYFFGDRGSTRPFVGAGAGTYWIQNRTEAGVFYVDDSNWHFGLLGEAGILIPRPGRTGFTLSARYNWALKANDIERPYMTFSVGYIMGN